jgi:transcriptional regulator with XRE-family HTH domain
LTLAAAELRGRRPRATTGDLAFSSRCNRHDPSQEERARAMSHENPHPIDIRIGQNLRLFRTRAGCSQTALADALGLTFQQIQKYEKATNRIAASRLFDCAKILNVSPAEFFASPGAPLEALPASDINRSLVNWLTIYQRLPSRPRRLVVQLAQLLSELPGE